MRIFQRHNDGTIFDWNCFNWPMVDRIMYFTFDIMRSCRRSIKWSTTKNKHNICVAVNLQINKYIENCGYSIHGRPYWRMTASNIAILLILLSSNSQIHIIRFIFDFYHKISNGNIHRSISFPLPLSLSQSMLYGIIYLLYAHYQSCQTMFGWFCQICSKPICYYDDYSLSLCACMCVLVVCTFPMDTWNWINCYWMRFEYNILLFGFWSI